VPYNIVSATPAGAPLADASGNVYQVTANRAAVSRSLQVSTVHTATPLRVRRVTTVAHGEMPAGSATTLQGGVSGRFASATPQLISIRDGITGEVKPSYVIASTYVTGGTLLGNATDTAGMVVLLMPDSTGVGDSTHCATLLDSLCVSRTSYGRVMSAGAPFALGDRALCTGAAIDLPAPGLVQTNAATGSNKFTVGQTYQYIVQYEYRAPDGTLFRGPPSDPVSRTITAPVPTDTVVASITATIAIAQESPAMPGLRVRLYRTEAGGSVYYDTNASVSSTGIGVYDCLDTTTDAELIDNTLLTDGPAVTGGIKARYGYPPHRCSWTGRDRVIVGGIENPRRVRWSLLAYPGEATAFPHASEGGWSSDLPDDVTAVAQLDDAWIVFSKTRIWSIYGSGPDDNGASGGFDPPRLVSANLGCVSWRSVAEIESGLLFQAADGQIYLLQRGQLTVQWFSPRVRDELNSGMLGTRLLNPIVATLPHDAAQTIHFVRAPLPSGLASGGSPVIVYDRRTDAWTTDGDVGVDGLNGAIGGSILFDVFSANKPGNVTAAIVTPTSLVIENATGIPMAPIGTTWTASLRTNDMAPFGLGGWGKVYRIGAIAETDSDSLSIAVSEWLSRYSGLPDCTGTMVYADAAVDFPFLSWAPEKDKCSAVRLQLSWTDTSSSIVGLVLSVEPSQGTQRLQNSRKS